MPLDFLRGLAGAGAGAGAGGPLGAIGGGLLGLFGGGNNDPSEEANKYLEQIPGTITPYYQPYVNAGTNALGSLQDQYGNLIGNRADLQNQYSNLLNQGVNIQGQYNQLMNDPNAIINRLGAGYQRSPGYDFRLKQGQQGLNNAAAAGGMLGSNQHQQQADELSQNIANQDYQQYLQQAMGLYGAGLQGNQNLYNTGLQGIQGLYNTGIQGQQGLAALGQQSASELANNLAQALMSQANLKYAGQANQNQQTGGMIGNLLGFGGGGGGLSNLFGLLK